MHPLLVMSSPMHKWNNLGWNNSMTLNIEFERMFDSKIGMLSEHVEESIKHQEKKVYTQSGWRIKSSNPGSVS